MKEEDINRIMDAVDKMCRLSNEAGKTQQKANALEMQAARMMDTVSTILRANADVKGCDK